MAEEAGDDFHGAQTEAHEHGHKNRANALGRRLFELRLSGVGLGGKLGHGL